MEEGVQQAIQLINILKYKNDKGSGVRLSFILIDNPQNTKNFKGCPVIDQFYDDLSLFDKVADIDFLDTVIVGHFLPKPQKNNPLKINSILAKLELEDRVIDLL